MLEQVTYRHGYRWWKPSITLTQYFPSIRITPETLVGVLFNLILLLYGITLVIFFWLKHFMFIEHMIEVNVTLLPLTFSEIMQVERTKSRPVASGLLTPFQGLSFLGFQLLLGLGILLQLNNYRLVNLNCQNGSMRIMLGRRRLNM